MVLSFHLPSWLRKETAPFPPRELLTASMSYQTSSRDTVLYLEPLPPFDYKPCSTI